MGLVGDVLVTEDPDDAALRAETVADRSSLGCALLRRPGALPPGVAARCAVVTMEPVAASDLTVLVDRQAATLHPMGRVVRPHLQSAETAGHMAELVAPPAEDDHDRTPAISGSSRDSGPGRRARRTRLSPGTVDVRLLTMTPRIDGLHEDLPPNRARRAVELVAYLALHQPDVITSDRLRTRVLGSSDADAAAKTLFNTAYAARRALGVDEHGDPLFPAGTRHGLYQLSPRVTVDVHRPRHSPPRGRRSPTRPRPSPTSAPRSIWSRVSRWPTPCRATRGGRPRGTAGASPRCSSTPPVVMASLASDAGRFDLARWGLEQARVVEPYSEALSRAAMQVAAAEGDADRLRLEWRDCQRRIDALDPGGSPSARTESLYGELSRRVLVGAALPDDVPARRAGRGD